MATHNVRMTNAAEGEVVVFLIGMRVNRWWKPWQWLRTAMAMPRILRELGGHPELGMLSTEAWFGRTTILLSYWKTMDHLLAYAKLRNAEHLPAWRAFNKHIGVNGDVGIWHEAYRVPAGNFETVYLNMPAFGLGKASGVREARGAHVSAAGRLGLADAAPADVSVTI
ncbi:MAG: DUF4188 domain-containing protein [Polyangiaceae bacterium]